MPYMQRAMSCVYGSLKTRAMSFVWNTNRHCGLLVSLQDSGSSGPGSIPGRGHCIVFVGKTLYSHSPSLHPGVEMRMGEFTAKGSPVMIPSRGE